MSQLAKGMIGLGVVIGSLFGINSASAAPKYPGLHEALYELREARTELKTAAHDFGGHREKALKDIDAAITQIEKALESQGDLNVKGEKDRDRDRYNKYPNHPHIHHAIHELGVAKVELKEAKHDFGGHREKAIKDIDAAIDQLSLALKFAKK
jgi:hypothetical protein